jgi:uncharacterized peroxidase-related enzyme
MDHPVPTAVTSLRFRLVEQATASARASDLLALTERQLGRVPNLYRAMANAPAALAAYLAQRSALQDGVLDAAARERIALLVAELNGCSYCVAAHVFRGKKIGLSAEELDRARQTSSEDPRASAMLRFTRAVVSGHGIVPEAELAAADAAGLSPAELGEIVAHIALNVFSNYFCLVSAPELDFPRTEVAHHG